MNRNLKIMLIARFSKEQGRGFTMVEVLVAIVILGIGVLGPLALAVRNVPDGNFIKNKMAATYLAKEGLELFLNKLDIFKASGVSLNTGETLAQAMVADSCVSSDGCGITPGTSSPTILGCGNPPTGSCVIQITSNDTTFIRRLRLISTLDDYSSPPPGYFNEYRVESAVSWRERNRDESVVLSTYIYGGEYVAP